MIFSGILNLLIFIGGRCVPRWKLSSSGISASLYLARMYHIDQMPRVYVCSYACGYQRRIGVYAFEGISAGEMSPCMYDDDRSLSCNSIVLLDSFDVRTMER